MDDPVSSWKALPRRLYLDTGTLQTLFDYGEQVWENELFVAVERDGNVPGLAGEVEALRLIMAINERAGFEFVVTDASLDEVVARGVQSYSRWARDVLDTWLVQSQRMEPVRSDADKPGSVSPKDWRLLLDALEHRCDAFLTMERRLFSQAPAIGRRAGIRVLRPTTYWALVAPWAALYR